MSNTSIDIADIPTTDGKSAQISVSYHKHRQGYFLVTAPFEDFGHNLRTFALSSMTFELIEKAGRFSRKRLEALAQIEKQKIEENNAVAVS